jgi:glycosyltransferase involved in cell wall biosynthesis
MNNASALRVAIDAQVALGEAGGIAPFVRNLVRALGRLTDGSERYVIVVKPGQESEWQGSQLGPNQTLVKTSETCSQGKPPLLVRALRPLRPAVRFVSRTLDCRVWPDVPRSDGFYEGLGCQVVHFPTQDHVLCALPTVYNPHDLQHLHYPQFWRPELVAWRETVYRAGCHFAHTVAVGSEWVKADVVKQYRVQPEKVQVIREAPSTEAFRPPSEERLAAVRKKYSLPQVFVFYPANTWSHKNHVRLLQAIADLREKRGLRIDLVCTGARYEPHWPPIEACVDKLNLRSQVRFLGFVPAEDLRAIYRLARFLIFPTLFEANSLPIFEAWLEGLPVVCSDIPSLREQVADAAQLFDPQRVESIAEAIAKNYTDATVEELRARGYLRLKQFSWERTAKTYRAVYRRTAGYALTDEDRHLLNGGASASHEPEKTEFCDHA